MSRIEKVLADLSAQKKSALIPYITAGDPKPSATVGFMHELVKQGADILELGVPFSDPMADGPTIQLACERALEHNTSLRDVLAMVAEFRQTDSNTPVVLMGYLNPIEVMGYESFAKQAAKVGVDGVLVVDLPPEEAEEHLATFKDNALDLIFLIAPTTTNERIEKIATCASGYVYYVSVKGVTGSAALDVDDVKRNVDRIKARIDVPVGVGFGIKDGETAAKVGAIAEGVIVGSAIVNRIAANANDVAQGQKEIGEIVAQMSQAMNA